MATFAQGLPRSFRPLIWLSKFLKQEVAPHPGRGALVARMTVAATIVMIINMTFRIPYGAYGAIYALIISRENPETTVKAVKTIIVAFALSVLYILIGASFFLQDPNLRLFWVIATLFVMFYVLSAASNYTAAARFGYLLVITIPLWDQQIPVGLKVEQTLWAFGAISLASLITIAIELIYAELKPHDVLLQPIGDRLGGVEELLDSYAAGYTPDKTTNEKITRFALAGNSALRLTLGRSAYSGQYREQMGAVVALVGRMIDVAADMIELWISVPEHERAAVRALAANVSSIRSDLLAGKVPHLQLNIEVEQLRGVPLLGEMGATVALIPEVFSDSASLDAYVPLQSSGDSALSLFKSDALTNPEHFKFGLKGCLAASLCYFLYNAKAWPGISTAITTCFLTALSTIGSSHQKQVLRISGAIVGGVVMGIGAEVFILPALDSIAGFTLLFIAATIIAAWFATSSPHLSYFGVQVAVAFYLINLSEFRVQTSLIPARDRVVGILLGLFVMWLVFDQLWGASAVEEMKMRFISILRLLAQFAREPLSTDLRVAAQRSDSLRETINNSFAQVRALADGVLFEFGPSRQHDLALRSQIIRSQLPLRMLFLTRIALWKYRARLPGFELPKPVSMAQREFDDRLATVLDGIADRMENRPSIGGTTFEGELERLNRAIRGYDSGNSHEVAAQFGALLSLCRRIQNLAVSLNVEIQGQ